MSQFVRTSKLTNTFNHFWARTLERGHQMLDPAGPEQIIEFEGGGQINFKGRTLDKIQKEEANNNRKYINLKNMETFYDLAQRRRNDIIMVNRVHKGHFLLTSDNPVVSSKMMFDPDAHFSMPLDAKHILMPYSKDVRQDRNIIGRSEMFEEMSYVQTLMSNVRQVENAERYVIGTKAHINNVRQSMEHMNEDDLKDRSEKVVQKINAMQALVSKINHTR